MSKKLLHLLGFVIHSPMNHTVGSWRHPRNDAAGCSFAEPQQRGVFRKEYEGSKLREHLAQVE